MTQKIHGNDTRFDSRVLDYAIRRKELSHQEVRDHLATLPDEADEAIEMKVKFSTPAASRAGARERDAASK
jgi:hypothetical protein